MANLLQSLAKQFVQSPGKVKDTTSNQGPLSLFDVLCIDAMNDALDLGPPADLDQRFPAPPGIVTYEGTLQALDFDTQLHDPPNTPPLSYGYGKGYDERNYIASFRPGLKEIYNFPEEDDWNFPSGNIGFFLNPVLDGLPCPTFQGPLHNQSVSNIFHPRATFRPFSGWLNMGFFEQRTVGPNTASFYWDSITQLRRCRYKYNQPSIGWMGIADLRIYIDDGNNSGNFIPWPGKFPGEPDTVQSDWPLIWPLGNVFSVGLENVQFMQSSFRQIPEDYWTEIPYPTGSVQNEFVFGKLGHIIFSVDFERPEEWEARTGITLS